MNSPEVLTPEHELWGNFRETLDHIVCQEGCDGSPQQARQLLGDVEYIDTEYTIAVFEQNGGFCDCEILSNVY
jgi:hypothetical protein